MTYTPPQDHLERYAGVLVSFALGGGTGISRGDVVLVTATEPAKPLYAAICREVWRAGGHVLGDFRPSDDAAHNLSRDFLELASDEQLDFFPAAYSRGLVDQCDHHVFIFSDADPHALKDVDPAKMIRHRRARKPMIEWQDEKENAGRFTWTAALYGTEAMAAEAQLSIEEYWEQITAACFLDDPDPVARWREVGAQIDRHSAWLNALPIERLHIEGEDVDLRLSLGEKRKWIGGGGRNIPSFEIFTSPDWRGTEGRIRFSEPLYVYGSLITGIELEFKAGRVVSARAEQNESLLTEMLASEGADRLGEFSLTDARLSRITKFMADTLFDENTGGPYGNTHLAVGRAFHACYDGDPTIVSAEEWEQLGFNDSAIHTDIVSTTDRTVTARLTDGSDTVIYESGKFASDVG